MLDRFIRFFLENKIITALVLLLVLGWGIATAPFDWQTGIIPRDPVPVDAIPDIGENQQIVFTEWKGRSPQDVEDQITYPLTSALLGLPGVKTVRSNSMFGFSSIYVIFKDDVEFYWSRSRILEKLNSLAAGTLPEGVQPRLGPDATALGQIFWYTLEGRDEEGRPVGGWDLHELRSVQDYYVKYALNGVEGVSEVASIGGFVREYQVDVDPDAMKTYGVSLQQVIAAVRESNMDVGAQTVEVNRVEYFVRGLGYIKSVSDLEEAVVTVREGTPLRLRDIARVFLGPAVRRGALDKAGAEVVGGVVVARYGENPLAVIERVKKEIEDISHGLPERRLDDGRMTKVTVVPFYDRTKLIHETLGTLEEALSLEVLITIIVVMFMVVSLRASILIAGMLPIAVLMVFIAMKQFHVEANIVALSGIAIAIGTMVDMSIILTENILRHLRERKAQLRQVQKSVIDTIAGASSEVAPAILTAISTTIVGFLPVFALQAAEGKLFHPLAFTKSFALVAALLVVLIVLPAVAHILYSRGRLRKKILTRVTALLRPKWFEGRGFNSYIIPVIMIAAVGYLLAGAWMPLGPGHSLFTNLLFIFIILLSVLGLFRLVIHIYSRILNWCLENKAVFLSLVSALVMTGVMAWMGFSGVLGFVAEAAAFTGVDIRNTAPWKSADDLFPGIGKEFMPSLDEGAFLLMPTSMPHAGIAENLDVVRKLDMAVAAIPEIEDVVGKLGRVESALDPAPISMYENVISYKPEYVVDDDGRRMRFETGGDGQFVRDGEGRLVPDASGSFYRNWRDHIHSADDIWDEIVAATVIPGVTSAPKLQPIQTRLVMLQTGMRAPMGVKVYGPDLESIESFSMKLEHLLKEVPGVKSSSVFADRIVGKPYLQIRLNRRELGRYGLSIADVQRHIEVAIGGISLGTTVEGRERYSIRVRYPRELRDSPDEIGDVLISTPTGSHIKLRQISEIEYEPGPQSIKSEDTFLVGYVIFDKEDESAEVDVVESAQSMLDAEIAAGALTVPGGVSYRFAGNYENQVRAEKRLSIVIPITLLIIFLILYLQFRSVSTTLMIFSSIAFAFAGGFLLIWFYGQGWFMNFSLFGEGMRDLFQIGTVNLSVAVWVGFIALFGIASDDGVVIATYLDQTFKRKKPGTVAQIRSAVIEAGKRRVKPCLMTTATTILALIPVLTSTGRGSDVMVPMAIPVMGGMMMALLTLFIVPVLYSLREERGIRNLRGGEEHA